PAGAPTPLAGAAGQWGRGGRSRRVGPRSTPSTSSPCPTGTPAPTSISRSTRPSTRPGWSTRSESVPGAPWMTPIWRPRPTLSRAPSCSRRAATPASSSARSSAASPTRPRPPAAGARAALDDGDDLYAVSSAALEAARAALARTPSQLPRLAQAGVVDAGGAGYVLLLESLARGVTGGHRARA